MSTIRPAQQADLPALAALHRETLGAHGPDPEHDLADMAQRGLVLCAESNAGIVGLAVGMVAADELEIYAVVVSPPARRTGLGTRLLAALEQAALTAGATRAFLEVRQSNAAAQALYSRAGYTNSGVRPAYYRDGEDAVLMQQVLAP